MTLSGHFRRRWKQRVELPLGQLPRILAGSKRSAGRRGCTRYRNEAVGVVIYVRDGYLLTVYRTREAAAQ